MSEPTKPQPQCAVVADGDVLGGASPEIFAIKTNATGASGSLPLTDEQLRLLIKACAGKDLMDRRDEAIVRLMAETGLRAGEVIAMQVSDVDLQHGRAIVRRGKGGKGRPVPFGPQTSRAIDRYLRLRRSHRLAGTPALWLAG